MSVFLTSTHRFSNVVKREYSPEDGYCRDVVVVNDAAATLNVGAVLGKVTATGKYKLVTAGAADGSQVAVAVVIGDSTGFSRPITLAGATDTKVLVLSRGPCEVAAGNLQVGADIDTGAELAAVYAQLKAVGIMAETTI